MFKMSGPRKRSHGDLDPSPSSVKKPRSHYLYQSPSENPAAPPENISNPATQDIPARPGRRRRRINNKEKYGTPEHNEAIQGLHENLVNPRFLPIFQAKPGHKGKLLARGRGAVKPEDYVNVVADHFLSNLSKSDKNESLEPPSYPATPVFGLAPPTTFLKPSQASAFTTIPPSINAAREKVNFNIAPGAPQKRTLPNAFEAPSNKPIPQRDIKFKNPSGYANIICTDLAPHKLILQTPVMKIVKPLDAEAKTPLTLSLYLPSIDLHSIDKAGVETKFKPVANLDQASSSVLSAKSTQPVAENSAPEVSEAQNSKRKVVSLEEYRLRQLNSKPAKSSQTSVEVLKHTECEAEEVAKTNSRSTPRDAPALPKLSFKAKSLPPHSHEDLKNKKNPLAISASKSQPNAQKRGAANFDGSFEMSFGKEAKQKECSDDAPQKPTPPATFSGFKISQPKQVAPQKTVRNPLKPVVNSKSTRIGSVLPEGKPKSAKVETPTGPAFKKATRRGSKPKEKVLFRDPKTFQPRKIRTAKPVPQDETIKPLEDSKSKPPLAGQKPKTEVITPTPAVAAPPITEDEQPEEKIAAQTPEQAPLTISTPQPIHNLAPPADNGTLALLNKLILLSNPPKIIEAPKTVKPAPSLKEYKFTAILPLLPRLLSKRLEREMNGTRKEVVVVEAEEDDEDSESDEEKYLDELERSLTIE